MKEGKRKSDHRALLVALVLLILVITILATVIIILPTIKSTISNDSDNPIRDCLQSSDVNESTDCIEEKVHEYSSQGDCIQALEIYDAIPTDFYDPYTLQDLYDQASSLSVDCDEGSQQEYWEEKSESLSNQLEGRD